MTERCGNGLATFAYLSVVHLAICMHGMLGVVLLCNYSGSEKADALNWQ